jgi:hypothetical protein
MNTQTNCTIINKIVSALAMPCLGVRGGAQGDKGMGVDARFHFFAERAVAIAYEGRWIKSFPGGELWVG